MRCLEFFELFWDGEIDFQSQHLDSYQSALEELIKGDYVYACSCNRKQLSKHQGIYPQTCRHKQLKLTDNIAIRVKTQDYPLNFTDGIQGLVNCNLESELGDFVIKRKDGFFAYQLAVVIDDYRQGITNVVRGFDLLDSTPRQIYLHYLLDLPTPHYSHIPIIIDAHGQKLSKQTQAEAVRPEQAHNTLLQLLNMLGQQPPAKLQYEPIREILNWAIKNWRIDQLQNQQKLEMPLN